MKQLIWMQHKVLSCDCHWCDIYCDPSRCPSQQVPQEEFMTSKAFVRIAMWLPRNGDTLGQTITTEPKPKRAVAGACCTSPFSVLQVAQRSLGLEIVWHFPVSLQSDSEKGNVVLQSKRVEASLKLEPGCLIAAVPMALGKKKVELNCSHEWNSTNRKTPLFIE